MDLRATLLFLLPFAVLEGCVTAPSGPEASQVTAFQARYEGGNRTFEVSLGPPENILDWDLTVREAYPFREVNHLGPTQDAPVGWTIVTWLDGDMRVVRTDILCQPPSLSGGCEATLADWTSREALPPFAFGLDARPAGPLEYEFRGLAQSASLSWREEPGLRVATVTGGEWGGASWFLHWDLFEFGFGEHPLPQTVKTRATDSGSGPHYNLDLVSFEPGLPLRTIAPWPSWSAGKAVQSGFELFPGEEIHPFGADFPSPLEAFKALLENEGAARESYGSGCVAYFVQHAPWTQLSSPPLGLNITQRQGYWAFLVDSKAQMFRWDYFLSRTLVAGWEYGREPEDSGPVGPARPCTKLSAGLKPVVDAEDVLSMVGRFPMSHAGRMDGLGFGLDKAAWQEDIEYAWGGHRFHVSYEGGESSMSIDVTANTGLLANARVAAEDLALWDRGQIKAASN